MSAAVPPQKSGSTASWALTAMMVAFTAFAVPYVARLNNFQIGDMEFTGWVGPIAERVAAGERLYQDLVLPIPPGAFLLLSAIQKIQGKALLLQELALAAVAHGLMGLLGYLIVRPLTRRVNALCAAAVTLVVVLQIHKECTYDHTAQLCAWGSIALGSHALAGTGSARRRATLLVAAGATAVFTFFFKQSTATGVVGGWLLAFGYLTGLSWFTGTEEDRRQTFRNLGLWLAGTLAGAALFALAMKLANIDGASYWQAVIQDGPELKGGTRRLIFNLFSHVVRQSAYPASFLFTLLLATVLMRLGRAPRGVHLDAEAALATPEKQLTLWDNAWFIGIVAASFGGAALLMLLEVRRIWAPVLYVMSWVNQLPAFGLFFFCAFLVATLRRGKTRGMHTGHATVAVTLAALVTSLLHNASFPGLRPLYDNNPIIPLAAMYLFVALDRAQLPRAKWATFALIMLSIFSPKLQRALTADETVKDPGHWAGLRVNPRGAELIKAATRARELAGPSGSVLVLPEDVQLRRLIGRPRPPTKGAILFVDQYPTRLLAADLDALRKHPPRVIVIHPARQHLWKKMFRMWNSNNATAKLMMFVHRELLPRYRRDSSFRTVFFSEQTRLEIWVRRD